MLTESRSTNRPRDPWGERGIVGVNLVIVLAFALFAVIQLTRVTIAALQIDDRVEVITGEVQPIDEELNQVAQLEDTNRTARAILEAAKPLSGQADQILAAAQSIDGKVAQINNSAASINNSASAIGGSIGRLLPVVRQINDGVAAINRRADTVIGLSNGVKTDLDGTLGHVQAIDRSAQSIDQGILVNGLLGSGGQRGPLGNLPRLPTGRLLG